MTPDDFSVVLKQRPFRPFTLHVGELTSFDIETPDQVNHNSESDVVAVFSPDRTQCDLVSLAHVPMISFGINREGDNIEKMLQAFQD